MLLMQKFIFFSSRVTFVAAVCPLVRNCSFRMDKARKDQVNSMKLKWCPIARSLKWTAVILPNWHRSVDTTTCMELMHQCITWAFHNKETKDDLLIPVSLLITNGLLADQTDTKSMQHLQSTPFEWPVRYFDSVIIGDKVASCPLVWSMNHLGQNHLSEGIFADPSMC